jgi:hypothetical protein
MFCNSVRYSLRMAALAQLANSFVVIVLVPDRIGFELTPDAAVYVCGETEEPNA